MKNYSPLRYPGGKSTLAGLIAQIRKLNALGDRDIAEPFAGGAGASLGLLFSEATPRILINDADRSIRDFWWSTINRSEQLLELIQKTRISIPEWRRQRAVYRDRSQMSRLKRGFATFYLNRCNRSGIIMNGGPIGGVEQAGKWKIDARFNKEELVRRCKKIAEYSARITVSGEDGIDFLGRVDRARTFFLIDPPYYEKGKTLYLNGLDPTYHRTLAENLRELTEVPWVLTYDDCEDVRKLYRSWAAIRPFSLRYAASEKRSGKEVMIHPKWMRLPLTQNSAAIGW
ncbi:DNA adenine methylase [Dongia sp.]|uniref:DNA adenine methylase n=1 Tax=Dongia sp. TaxID=1977262 RepID=UPI0035AD8180